MKRISRKIDPILFDKPNTEAAYWMGFIYADGSISVRPGKIIDSCRCTVGVNVVDHKHLCALQKFLGFNDKPRINTYKTPFGPKTESKVSFCHTRLLEIMRIWGVVPNKTYVDFVEPQISDELLPHFLRGWFDGDGSFSIDGKTNSFRISTSLEAANWYAQSLKRLGYEGSYKIVPNGKSSFNYNLRIDSTLRIYMIGDLLSPFSEPKLNRKWDKYKEIVSRVENRQYKTPIEYINHRLSLSPKRSEKEGYKYELKL